MERDAIVAEITRVVMQGGLSRLSQRSFQSATGIANHVVARHFDRWSEACAAAGIACETNDKLVPNPGASRQECLDDILRVAKEVGTTSLTRHDYRRLGRYPGLKPVYRHFGSWPSALDAAGLIRSNSYHEPIPFDTLAMEYVLAAATLGRMPTIRELKRRGRGTIDKFIAKYGGYSSFKRLVADWFFVNEDSVTTPLDRETRESLLIARTVPGPPPDADPAPHRRGKVLGFRQFAYAPTQEQDVVAIFNAVASDLGFEILANRVKFPDCLARERQAGARGHFLDCRIEFEFRSRDYFTHRHPINGCDLIVCWEHNWDSCPIRVLELVTRIRQLPGWG